MRLNIHPLERMIRVVGGVVLMSLAFWGPRNPWFLLAAIPTVTGFLGWCPLYTLLGISTCSRKLSGGASR